MDRRKIEHFTASLAITLLFINTIGAILAAANTFFQWDIFPPHIEKVIWFIFHIISLPKKSPFRKLNTSLAERI